jgi:hypothetical protein
MDATLTVDTSPISQLDRRFFAVLLASMLVHAIAAAWVARQPHVAVVEEPYVERPRERVTLPPLLPIPKSFPPPALPKKSGGPPGNSGGSKPPALGALLGSAVAELTSREDARSALEGARAGHVDTTAIAVRRETGPGAVQAIAPITTNVQSVGIGEHHDAVVRPVVEPIVIDDPPPTDPEVFLRYINSRRPALAACYESELKRNRSLKGRITVQLTVATDGRARAVEVDPGSLGSRAVTDCIEALVRRWTFPTRPDDEVPLQFPVLFSPAG